MRFSAKSCALAAAVIFGACIFAETLAFAQCPPGLRWSNRAGRCVPITPPPPPPGAYMPPPPPPPPPGRRGCNRSYQNCLYVCAGVPQCVNNCNIGYSMCVGGS